ncbi:response regulator transcription factor [Cohnella nanjingensis]|uniref:Response regulator n=1 Tax=Cohnella nanjingensis TaxID=1387779 RepID=A0A7X0RT98_9BACL|nr:response regulator [Cohnella nanjingensis]MBB6673175.1 response regulator [Cohnella nanjingensis]
MKVMIVEDEILVRLGLRKAIPWSTLGMELVCEAQDGDEAYELFKLHLPDIVVVDIELPKMNGLQFIRYAKTQRPDSRFIVLTCHQDMKYMREAIQLQVNDFMLKSTLDMDELCGMLQSLSFDLTRERGETGTARLSGEAAESPIARETAERAYYALETAPIGPLREMLSEPEQQLRRDIFERLESLQFAVAKQKLGELREALTRPPLLHPHVVKNTMTEFLFRAWSACEALAAGKQAAHHRLVDRIYAAPSLDETVALLEEEMDRLEGLFALTHSGEDKAKIVLLIKQYIKTHLDREISLQDIASAFYINSSYLSRLFKEVSRTSFTEYVLYEKTELAIVMMKSGKTLTEISEKLGYLNLSSFTRMFKKVRGSSPSRYLDG